MSGSKTNYLENAWGNFAFRNQAFTSPTTVYLGLMTGGADFEAGTVTEVSGFGYARQAVTFAIPASRSTSNSGTVTFPTASGGAWGTITNWGIWDALTTGNLLYYASLDASRTINDTDSISFPTGNVVVTETGGMTTYLANALLNHTLRNTAYTPVATIYTALLTAVSDGLSGSVTEVSGGSYARQSIAFSAASGGVISNSGTLTYPVATAGWGTVVSWGLYDALTLGNLLGWNTFTTAKTVNTNDTFTLSTGAVSVTED